MSATINQRSAEIFEHELLNPLRGHELTTLESFVASLLLEASGARPLDNRAVRDAIDRQIHLQVSARTVKGVIRRLRKDHAFPILARREKPFGYFWCASKEEMEEFISTFRAQAIDELHTLGRIVRENFPDLAGQLRLEEEAVVGGR